MNSQHRTLVPTNIRESILQDPTFATARQSLQHSLDDFKRMSNALGMPIMAGPEAMQQMISCLGRQQQYHPPCVLSRNTDPLSITMHTDNMTFQPDRFEIVIDVKGFTPEEIAVTLQDNVVDVTAEHSSEGASTTEQRSMQRHYFLPHNVQADALQSNLSCDGVLVLSAPWRLT